MSILLLIITADCSSNTVGGPAAAISIKLSAARLQCDCNEEQQHGELSAHGEPLGFPRGKSSNTLHTEFFKASLPSPSRFQKATRQDPRSEHSRGLRLDRRVSLCLVVEEFFQAHHAFTERLESCFAHSSHLRRLGEVHTSSGLSSPSGTYHSNNTT